MTGDLAVFVVANALLSSVEETGNEDHRDRCWAVAERFGPLFMQEFRASLRRMHRPHLAKIPYRRES